MYLMLSFLRSSCFEHSCDQSRDRNGQLFGFLDNFLAGPQENPITLPTGSDGKGSFTLAKLADENAATRDNMVLSKLVEFGVYRILDLTKCRLINIRLISSIISNHLKTWETTHNFLKIWSWFLSSLTSVRLITIFSNYMLVKAERTCLSKWQNLSLL